MWLSSPTLTSSVSSYHSAQGRQEWKTVRMSKHSYCYIRTITTHFKIWLYKINKFVLLYLPPGVTRQLYSTCFPSHPDVYTFKLHCFKFFFKSYYLSNLNYSMYYKGWDNIRIWAALLFKVVSPGLCYLSSIHYQIVEWTVFNRLLCRKWFYFLLSVAFKGTQSDHSVLYLRIFYSMQISELFWFTFRY